MKLIIFITATLFLSSCATTRSSSEKIYTLASIDIEGVKILEQVSPYFATMKYDTSIYKGVKIPQYTTPEEFVQEIFSERDEVIADWHMPIYFSLNQISYDSAAIVELTRTDTYIFIDIVDTNNVCTELLIDYAPLANNSHSKIELQSYISKRNGDQRYLCQYENALEYAKMKLSLQ